MRKNYRRYFKGFILLWLILPFPLFAQYQYTSPKSNSTNLPTEHNIVLRPGPLLDPVSAQQSLFSIQGSVSGAHDFALALCDDGKTINLNPTIRFSFEETVTVSISEGLMTAEGDWIPSSSFSFTTTPEWNNVEDPDFGNEDSTFIDTGGGRLAGEYSDDSEENTNLFTVGININPAPGYIFFDYRPRIASQLFHSYLNVITSDGDSVFRKLFSGYPYDFEMGHNGLFETFHGIREHFDVMDSNFNVIDSFSIVNGFDPDPHEMIMLENGYVFLTGLENQPVGDTSLQIIQGSVIQEFDTHHNLLFEWRSFDHIDVSEAIGINTQGGIDYVHTNSIDVDTDGNIIVSHRHLNQINKIDVGTGDFIWRLGGVNNEFTFLNDTARFTYQHNCRRMANGHLTLYDNGNLHAPQRSYAKEYELDVVNKTANLVWSYHHPDVDGNPAFYTAMGSVQRLPNGNTFINWGWTASNAFPSMTEVDSTGNIVWEMKLPSTYVAYRAHKYEWNPCARPTSGLMTATELLPHSAKLNWQPVANPSEQYEVQYRKHNESTWTSVFISSENSFLELKNLESETEYDWRLQSWCNTTAGTSSHCTEVKSFTTTGIEIAENNIIVIYPNPAGNQLIVESPSYMQELIIQNPLGQICQSPVFFSTQNGYYCSMDVSSLPAGIYLVTAFSNQQQVTKMFVKE